MHKLFPFPFLTSHNLYYCLSFDVERYWLWDWTVRVWLPRKEMEVVDFIDAIGICTSGVYVKTWYNNL